MNVKQTVLNCTHLSQNEQNDLKELLHKFPKLFNGKLGKYTGEKIHLDVDPNAKPHASHAYAIPHRHCLVFKDELDRLVKISVLEQTGCAEWIAGSFVIPKKDGRI